MKFVYFDFEVFSNDWMVVLLTEEADGKKPEKFVMGRDSLFIHNNPDRLLDFYEANKEYVWVGYNCNHYDQWILKAILSGIEPKKMNDWIIVEEQAGWTYGTRLDQLEMKRWKLKCFDVYNRVTDGGGLKGLESSMGVSIKEFYIKLAIKRLKDFGINYVRADGVVYEDEKKVNSRDVVWQQKYEIAKQYFEKQGDLNIKGKVMIGEVNITSWIQTQRKNYKSGKLSEERIKLLNDIGMVWDKG